MISLDSEKPESFSLLEDKVGSPRGIFVDQMSGQLYWIDDSSGDNFVIETSNGDGTDRKILFESHNQNPSDITMQNNTLYWTDYQNNKVWKFLRTENTEPTVAVDLKSLSPNGIVAYNKLTYLLNHTEKCTKILQRLEKDSSDKLNFILSKTNQKTNILTATTEYSSTFSPSSNKSLTNQQLSPKSNGTCFNNGQFISKLGKCKCTHDFISGDQCEKNKCFNYCLNDGECFMTQNFKTECKCPPGYEGDRCEIEICNVGYCLNNGICSLENGQPICECMKSFKGRRCDSIDTKYICKYHCYDTSDLNLIDSSIESKSIDDLNEICSKCNITKSETKELHSNDVSCGSSYNSSVLILVIGVITALTLVLLILLVLKRTHKPLRPKIKKTFVVKKNLTALTSRPSTTEQCEITIENCCNMNICETPCFDPKILQGNDYDETKNFTNNKFIADDEKNLLNNMEGNDF